MVGLFELFKFVDSLDQLLILTGVLCASVAGCMFPLMFYIFGDLTNAFALQAVISPEQFMDLIISVVWKMCAIGNVTKYIQQTTSIITGGGMWVSHYIFVACLNYSAERQVLRVRKEFFSAVLRQDLAWYDTATTAEFATRMTEDLNKLQVGE